MDAALLHPSRFIKSQEFLGKDVTYTIERIDLEDLEDENNKIKTKGVISFKETKKLWVINRTNSDCLKGMWGRETNDWIGKRVTLFPAPFFDNFKKEHTTAIRVRGSPDLKESVTVTVQLPRKKPQQMKMVKTGTNGAPPPMEGDELERELVAISELIAACQSPEECDALWNGALKRGVRLNALPPADKDAKVKEFSARKGALKKALAAPPPEPEVEAPPPA